MGFTPNYTFSLISEEAFPATIEEITKELSPYRQEGTFTSFDKNEFYYEYFLAEGSTASVVIVHGLSEFTQKFYEATWYFLHQGYNVFLYDQRGHGKSCRLTDRPDLIHVDRFDDYVEDLDCFIEKVVLPAEDKPLYLYSHSMGGAVSLRYLSRHGEKIKKAVLSAPLFIANSVNLPQFIINTTVWAGRILKGKKKRFFFCHDFDPNHPFSRSSDKSFNRFTHYLKLRRENPCYQTSPMTYGWTTQSLKLNRQALKKSFIKKITTPILLISAGADTVVKTKPHHKFANKCKSCTLLTIAEGNHGMLVGTQETIGQHVEATLAFFQD